MSKPGFRPGHGRIGNPVEKPKDLKGALIKIWDFLKQFRLLLILVFVFAIGSTVFNIIGPKILSTATTELFNGVSAKVQGAGGIDFNAIARILLLTLVLYIVSAVCSFVQSWTMSYVSQRSAYVLRQRIEQKINTMPLGYFEKNPIGDTLSRITNDVDTLGQSLNQGITQLITSLTTLIGILTIMLIINPLITLVAIATIVLSAALVSILVKFSQKYFTAQQEILGLVNSQVEENFSGHTILKAFSKEKETIEVFEETNERLYESVWKSQFISGVMSPVMTFVGNLGYVSVALLGSYFAVRGIISVGDIQAFIQYIKNLSQPITQLAQVSNVLQQMAAAAERVFEFLEEEEETADEVCVGTEELSVEVDFDHVRFGYEQGQTVIQDFSAHVETGQTVALVGPTGAGKTTIVKLLMRFYDVDAGVIKIGGVNIKELSRTGLRSLFSMVLQDTWLFKGSIRENIRYGRLTASDEEVEAAAKAAYIHHFIMTLPDAYETEIGEDGGSISQGQRQLITIARAFLANRRMLILDEATSSVDTRTEERIQKAMDKLMEDRTSFVIAHRLSTIKHADLIVVIRNGDIVEQGTHEELLAMGGFYEEMYNSQFANRIELVGE